jgi:hypothetical protein
MTGNRSKNRFKQAELDQKTIQTRIEQEKRLSFYPFQESGPDFVPKSQIVKNSIGVLCTNHAIIGTSKILCNRLFYSRIYHTSTACQF